jgi:hypothetical protein
MANKSVKIYESVRAQGKWTSVSVEIAKLKPDNTLYLKDGREGKFRISWYEGTKKQWHPTTCRNLGEALKVKAEKEWFLQNQNRPGVQDPTTPDSRATIAISVERYVESITGSKKTKSAYAHAVKEFAEWNASLKNGSKKTFVEEIDKALMARFFDYLVDDEPENHPYTAALKLLRVNAFMAKSRPIDALQSERRATSGIRATFLWRARNGETNEGRTEPDAVGVAPRQDDHFFRQCLSNSSEQSAREILHRLPLASHVCQVG